MMGEPAYISFCGVLAPTFGQTTSNRCLGAECDKHSAHQLLSENRTIRADVALNSMFVSYVF